MLTNLKRVATAGLIGAALSLTPSPTAAAPAAPEADPTTAELKTQLDATDKKVDKIQKSLERLTELLEGRRDDRGFVLPSDQGIVAELRAIKDEMSKLKTQVEGMKSTTALKPTTAGKGTVRVVNEYPVEVTIILNNKTYRVAANTKLDIDVPAGEFEYQLLQSGAVSSTRSKIADKEIVTLRVR